MMSMNILTEAKEKIQIAAEKIKSGDLVAFPTETVYGLGADATNDSAVAKIFSTKGRPSFNPLIIHVSSIDMAKRYVQWSKLADILANRFWPGALTLVLPRIPAGNVSLLASAGGDTLGVRMPAHPLALAIIESAGVPLAAPSANKSGRVSPTTAQHVRDEFGDTIYILDGGACGVGVESTVLDISDGQPLLLRPGGITAEAVESVLNQKTSQQLSPQQVLRSPGMLESHYAPSRPVRLNAVQALPGEALLAFGGEVPAGAARTINLSETGNTTQAAARLFAAMRELDTGDYSAIAVMPIPEQGLGVAINDRLRRAAAGR